MGGDAPHQGRRRHAGDSRDRADGARHGRRPRQSHRGRLRRLRHQTHRAAAPAGKNPAPARRNAAGMTDPLSGEALAHLRHDLRTPINHILGYTEILLEDAGDADLDEFSPALREMNAGGRQLLEWIQGALAESGSSVPFRQLEALEAKLRPRAEQLLRAAESLVAGFHERAAAEAEADMGRVSSALRRLLALLGQMIGVTYEVG